MDVEVALAAVIAAAALAGCVDDDGDGGDGAPDIPQALLDLHAECASQREGLNATADRPVCNPENPVGVLNTSMGVIRVELYTDVAPETAGNFVNLTRDGFYDGTRFHRVIDDFVIQDGDPLSKDTSKRDRWGTGGPGYAIQDEWPCKDGTIVYRGRPDSYEGPAGHCDGHGGMLLTHGDQAGVLSMANSGANTGGSQYFVSLDASRVGHLDGRHAIFGQVIGGMDVVQAIGDVPTDDDGQPRDDVLIDDVAIEGA